MRKKALIILVLMVLSVVSSHSQEKIDYRQLYDLKGNVKQSVTRSRSESSTIVGRLNSFGLDKETVTFNELGQVTKIEAFVLRRDSTFELLSKDTFSYENGFLKGEESYDSNDELQVSYQFTKHNERGFPLEAMQMQNDDREKIVYEYKDLGLKQKTIKDGRLKCEYIASYDKKGYLVRETLREINDSGKWVTIVLKTFEYSAWDNSENWTRRTIKEEKTKTTILQERELIYF